jgi:hypothetical protein
VTGCDPVEKTTDLVGDVGPDTVLERAVPGIGFQGNTPALEVRYVRSQYRIEFSKTVQHGTAEKLSVTGGEQRRPEPEIHTEFSSLGTGFGVRGFQNEGDPDSFRISMSVPSQVKLYGSASAAPGGIQVGVEFLEPGVGA